MTLSSVISACSRLYTWWRYAFASLNVYIPHSDEPGYVFGNPANWPFDHWIHQSPNVVVASVYYRLDSFGFLSHPDFNGDLAINNAGFLDQIEALKWIKRNIAAFGGNPEKVTINGQSAGGGSVLFHIVAKEEPGLFSGAIAQSVARGATPLAEQKEVRLVHRFTWVLSSQVHITALVRIIFRGCRMREGFTG